MRSVGCMRGMGGMGGMLLLRLLLLSHSPLFVRLHQAVDNHELDTLALGCDGVYDES